MAIKVQCPNPACGQIITVRDEYAGKRGKCPVCGGAMMIPAGGNRESLSSRPAPMQQDYPRSGIPVDAPDTANLSPLTPVDELRLPPADVLDAAPAPPPAEPPPPPYPSAAPQLVAGYTMAELATRTALIIGIVSLVLLSLIPQVRWLYLSRSSSDPERNRDRTELIQLMFLGQHLGTGGPGATFLMFSGLLAFGSVVCLLLRDTSKETSDQAIAVFGGLGIGWGVTVFFWLLGFIWKAFALASEIGSRNFTVLPGFGLIIGFFAALAIIAVFGYLVASRRRWVWLAASAGLGFFFGLFLLVFNVRPWDVKLVTSLGGF